MRNPIARGRFRYNLGPVITPPDAATITGPEPPPPPAVVQAASSAPRQKNRREKRRDAAFNRQLNRRLEKEKVPVKVEVLPDGGLHVTADMREEKS